MRRTTRARSSSSGPGESGDVPTPQEQVLAATRDAAQTDLLNIVFFHLRVEVKLIPALRLTCRSWADVIDERVNAADRLDIVVATGHEKRNLFAHDGPTWLIASTSPRSFLDRYNSEYCNGKSWFLLYGPPRDLISCTRWHRMTPIVNRVRAFDLTELDLLPPPGAPHERFLRLLECLAWLPMLESITLGELDNPYVNLHDLGENREQYLQDLTRHLGGLNRVHTIQGNLGFYDPDHPYLFGCVSQMPSLKHLKLDFWQAFPTGPRTEGVFRRNVEALATVRLETLLDLYMPYYEFFPHFTSITQDRLAEFQFSFDAAHEDAESIANYMACIFDAVQKMPNLQKLRIRYDQVVCDGLSWDGSGEPAENSTGGWVKARELLFPMLVTRMAAGSTRMQNRESWANQLAQRCDHTLVHAPGYEGFNDLFTAAVQLYHGRSVTVDVEPG